MKLENYFTYNENLKSLWKECESLYLLKKYYTHFIFLESFIKKILIINIIEKIESGRKWNEMNKKYFNKSNIFNYEESGIKKHNEYVLKIMKKFNLKKLIDENYKKRILPFNSENFEMKIFFKKNPKIKYCNINKIINERNNVLHDWLPNYYDNNYYKIFSDFLYFLLNEILENTIDIKNLT